MTGKDIKPLYGCRGYNKGNEYFGSTDIEEILNEHQKIIDKTYQTETRKKEKITEPGEVEKIINTK